MRKTYARDQKRVVLMQSCIRRRQAKNELKVLKNEARSVVHFKEVSYKLENTVVTLTQTLQRRTVENKELQTKLKTLDSQLQSWITKFDDVDGKHKTLQVEHAKPTVALKEFEALDKLKQDLDARLSGSLRKIAEQDAQIKKLSEEYAAQTLAMDVNAAKLTEVVASSKEDSTTVSALRAELSSLREQLSRQVNSNSSAKATPRPDGTNFNMATGRAVEHAAGLSSPTANGTKRRGRRHSDLGTEQTGDALTEDEERWESPRAVSAFPAELNGVKRYTGGATKGYLPEVYDDPAEEIMKLLEDEEPLDEDVLQGIIRFLKVPAPNFQNPPSTKEVLFPAHLISLVTNEMWKYGMMSESERFLANVMQTVQQHVMVRPPPARVADRAGVPGRGFDRARHLLALERARDPLVRVHRRARHRAGHRARERGRRSRVRMDRLRAPRHDRQARPRLARVQHLPHLDAGDEEEAPQDGHPRLDRVAVAARIRHVRDRRAPLQPSRLDQHPLAPVQHGRHPQPAEQGVEEPQELLRRARRRPAGHHRAPQAHRRQQLQRPAHAAQLLFVEARDADPIVRRPSPRLAHPRSNITRLEEWCKSHDMPEGTLQLEHLMQATKLLQLKKATLPDIEIIYESVPPVPTTRLTPAASAGCSRRHKFRVRPSPALERSLTVPAELIANCLSRPLFPCLLTSC